MHKALGTWVVALAVVAVTGCVATEGDDGPVIETDTAALVGDPLAQIVISPKPSMMGQSEAVPTTEIPEDPCDCATPQCLHDWLELNVGCDLCLTFVCAGEESAHVCAACTGEANGPRPQQELPHIQ